jgi:hypothetical protein
LFRIVSLPFLFHYSCFRPSCHNTCVYMHTQIDKRVYVLILTINIKYFSNQQQSIGLCN